MGNRQSLENSSHHIRVMPAPGCHGEAPPRKSDCRRSRRSTDHFEFRDPMVRPFLRRHQPLRTPTSVRFGRCAMKSPPRRSSRYLERKFRKAVLHQEFSPPSSSHHFKTLANALNAEADRLNEVFGYPLSLLLTGSPCITWQILNSLNQLIF